MLSLLIPLLFSAPLATAISVLVPLYVYPDTSTTWSPLFNTVHAHPHVNFTIIVNPDSGPGAAPYPDSNYIAGLTKLHSYPNTKLIGYVDTAYTSRSIGEVENDVSIYAGWANYTASPISVSGIFFDDATSADNAGNYTYMAHIASYARKTLNPTLKKQKLTATVIFNSGDVPPIRYFGYADTIVEFESPFSNYDNSTINSFAKGKNDQAAVIIYSFEANDANGQPADGPALKNLVEQMKQKNVEFVGVTRDCCYNVLNATVLGELAAAVAAA